MNPTMEKHLKFILTKICTVAKGGRVFLRRRIGILKFFVSDRRSNSGQERLQQLKHIGPPFAN